MRIAWAFAASAALVSAQIVPAGDLCDPDYDCLWTHVASNNVLYDYDFSHHCSSFGYQFVDANDHTYSFNICGRSPRSCLPKGYSARYTNGEAVQFWGAHPACDLTDNTTQCLDPVSQKYYCCTQDCEVLGVGTPIWHLLDESNPETGGVSLKHMGVAPSGTDPNTCPNDPETGGMAQRSVTIILHCDQSLPDKDLQINSAYENASAPCNYIIDASTKAACGCAPQCDGKLCGDDKCFGYCSGAALAGNCPYGQKCMADQSCCRPDCGNRDCGDDGCGGSCGTCGTDEECSAQLVCKSTTPFVPSAPEVFKSDGGGLTGAFFGGAISTLSAAGVVWFFRYGGRARFDAWRHGPSGGSVKQSLMTTSSSSAATPSAPAAGARTATGGSYGSYGT